MGLQGGAVVLDLGVVALLAGAVAGILAPTLIRSRRERPGPVGRARRPMILMQPVQAAGRTRDLKLTCRSDPRA
jgi:hypothetical protein